MPPTYAELHCHTNFSFLDGASPAEDLVERARELGIPALAVTDHDGLYGVVRFALAAEAAGIRPIVGVEVELLDAAASDPAGIVIPARRPWRPGGRTVRRGAERGPDRGDRGAALGSDALRSDALGSDALGSEIRDGRPLRPRPARTRLPGHRRVVKEDLRGIGERQRGPHLVLLARDGTGYRSLCRLVSRANLNGTKRVPQFRQSLLAKHAQGLIALSGCREGEIARRLRAGDREGAAAVARRYAELYGRGDDPAHSGFFLELSHHLLPDDDWLVSETAALADELGLPVVVTNDVHHARPEDRELGDVLTAIFHGRTLDTLADLRRPGESHLKSGSELAALPPGDSSFATADPRAARRWAEGIATSGELAASCSVELGFEQYRFPGFEVPRGETPFSYLSELCWAGARRRYHPMTPEVVNRLAHELSVIERAGLAEFFLICWDLMRFAKEQRIPAQGRGSATSSIVSYTLGISRVEPIAHNLLFERFINEGRTTYPDVDIDFSSERREEVIQYIYRRYGPEHTGMVCNLVTYRARSAVREIGYALGFPRPLVDRVAKALETYDSVMVRRDLEAEGGFAEFFRKPGEGEPAARAGDAARATAARTAERGLTDPMGQLNHARGGRFHSTATEHGTGRQPRIDDTARPDDLGRGEAAAGESGARESAAWEAAGEAAVGEELVDGMGQLNKRMPLVGKVPPWRQPPAPSDPAALRPFAWLADADTGAAAGLSQGPSQDVVPRPGDHPGMSQIDMERGPGREDQPDVALLRASASESIPGQAWAGMNAPAQEARVALETDRTRARPRVMAICDKPQAPGLGEARMHTVGAFGADRTGGISAPGAMAPEGTSALALTPAPGSGRADVGPGPSRTGMWEEAPQSPPAIRPGRSGDDEGGPGDTPASVAWLRAGRGTGYARDRGAGGYGGAAQPDRGAYAGATPRDRGPHAPAGRPHAPEGRVLRSAQAAVDGRAIDPESGALAPPARRTDTAVDRLGRPNHWAQPDNIRGGIGVDRIGRADPHRDAERPAGMALARPEPHSSVARVEPQPAPQPRGGSTVGLSDWERWLEFCARIDGFPRHLSIHSGGMLVTAAPLIDIAPLERATMKDRVVVQFDKRDVEELKLIKLDLLGLGMLAAIDETVQLIEHDCATCLVLDAIPEQIREVFEMVRAADTVGVFQIESRAQMQTLPKSRPTTLDDLVVEVAIIRPGPIQGNAVHPFLRRKQGLEPVTYLHPSLEPVLRDSMGVILYQEQVMRIAIEVAGFSPAESDGFRRAMGTWRSTREMEKLHQRFHDGCLRQPGMTEEIAEELFRQVSAFASFGFAKSHAAAFARTAYESSFLKLFYPAQFLVGLINAQPMGFYPVEVLVNDARRHGVNVLPVDLNASSYRTTTEWVGQAGPIVDSPSCVVPGEAARRQWAAESAMGWGVRLGLQLVKGIGEQHQELLDRELERGPYASLADVVARTGLPEETIERLIRTGALDSLGRARRELLWQLREVAGSTRARVDGKALRAAARASGKRSAAAGRPMDLRLPATDAPALPPITEAERLGDAYAVVGLDAKRQVIELFRPSLGPLGVVTAAELATHRPGPVRIAGLVVTRQHPMTARGTVFLALEDETGMVNVTLWPDTWARLRGVVRRHALLLVDGDLQRESSVVNVVARDVRALTQVVDEVAGREGPEGVRQLGHAGMRRLG